MCKKNPKDIYPSTNLSASCIKAAILLLYLYTSLIKQILSALGLLPTKMQIFSKIIIYLGEDQKEIL